MKKVFLSYAREDSPTAEIIYNDLSEEGFDVWFDEESLNPGEYWEKEIEDAINTCDYFIALISKNSVVKEGVVNKEISIATNREKKKPEGEVFIIPVKIDKTNSEIEKLKNKHYTELIPTARSYHSNLKKIVKGMGARSGKKGKYIKKNILIWHPKEDIKFAKYIQDFLRGIKIETELLNEGNYLSHPSSSRIIRDASCFILLLSASINLIKIENTIVQEALKQHGKRKSFIIPVEIDDFDLIHEKLKEIHPIRMPTKSISDEKDSIDFEDEKNRLLEEVINHLQFWDFEGRDKSVLINATNYTTQRYLNAITNYDGKTIKLNFNDYFIAGLNSFARKNYEDALKRFLLATIHGLPMTKADVLSKIGACFIKLNKPLQAHELLDKAIREESTYPTSYYNKGILLKKEGNLDEAIKSFEKAAQTMERYEYMGVTSAYNNICTTKKDLYKATGDFKYIKEAIDVLSEKVPNDDSGLTQYNQACFNAILQKYDVALEYLAESFEKDHENIMYAIEDVELLLLQVNEKNTFWKLVSKYSSKYQDEYAKEMIEIANSDMENSKLVDLSDRFRNISDVKKKAIEKLADTVKYHLRD